MSLWQFFFLRHAGQCICNSYAELKSTHSSNEICFPFMFAKCSLEVSVSGIGGSLAIDLECLNQCQWLRDREISLLTVRKSSKSFSSSAF